MSLPRLSVAGQTPRVLTFIHRRREGRTVPKDFIDFSAIFASFAVQKWG